MRIMSFNLLCGGRGDTHWLKRIYRIVKTIKDYSPDTIGVQEAHLGWITALKTNLRNYDYVGVGREDGRSIGEFSAVFYKKDKFELLDSGNFWLSETPDKPGKGWDAACVRICSYALLREKATGKKLAHFNTHLDHIGEVAMQKGAELVAAKTSELFGGIPAVFTGDFNVTPESAPCKAVKDGGYTDSRDVAVKTDMHNTFHGYFSGDEGKNIIDYVFVKGDITVNEFKVITEKIDGIYPSDHFAVYSDIEF